METINYKVVDKKGILYSSKGFEGGDIATFPEGAIIRQVDVDRGFISLGGLESLEKAGRVVKLDVGGKNKAEGKTSTKGAVDE
jgi:hypothetical protein